MKIPQSSSQLQELLNRRKTTMAEHLLSSSSTLFNLAVSGSRRDAFLPGCYYLMPGDSDSGKTVVGISTLAEAVIDPYFREYEIVFDNAENGMLMDIRGRFGKKVAKRIRPPKLLGEGRIGSETVEEFYDALSEELKQPCIYLLDSNDALVPEAERKRYVKNKNLRARGQEVDQSYGTEKAKLNSQGLRNIIQPLRNTGSILIMIAQSRDDVNARFGDKKTRSGGRALKFFCTADIWTSQIGELKKKITAKKQEQVGIKVKVKVKRTRQTGQHRAVQFPIYWSYGIDNIGSCIDFLLEWGHWKKVKGMIRADEFEFKGRVSDLIRHIEKEELEETLNVVTAKCWKSINEALDLDRKPRYSDE